MLLPKLRVTRWAHRAASLVLISSIVAGNAIGFLGRPSGDWLETSGDVLLMLGITTFLFMRATHFEAWADATDDRLDERERARRDDAHRIANQLGTLALVFTFFALLSSSLLSDASWHLTAWETTRLMFWSAVVLAVLPGAVLAWRGPDELPDDESFSAIADV